MCSYFCSYPLYIPVTKISWKQLSDDPTQLAGYLSGSCGEFESMQCYQKWLSQSLLIRLDPLPWEQLAIPAIVFVQWLPLVDGCRRSHAVNKLYSSTFAFRWYGSVALEPSVVLMVTVEHQCSCFQVFAVSVVVRMYTATHFWQVAFLVQELHVASLNLQSKALRFSPQQ